MPSRTSAKPPPAEPEPARAPITATYDLVLMLDCTAEAPARAEIVAEAKRGIDADGELLRHYEWGERELAYQIRHRDRAEYHLLQFRPATTGLLDALDRSLSIADQVLRFRIVKLKPGTPAAPEMPGRQPSGSSAAPAASAGSDTGPTASRHAEATSGTDAQAPPAAADAQAPPAAPDAPAASEDSAPSAADSPPAAADSPQGPAPASA